MNDAKEEIRDRLNIEEVVSDYVELKRSGRNFKALSPFSNEKTPSFMVSPDKKIWHDFSSGKGGDVFSFIMEVEGLDFKDTLQLLARRAGVELKYYDSENSQKVARLKETELEMYRLATLFYSHTIMKNPHALDYATISRSLNRETFTNFKIGYSPEIKDSLVQFLLKKGYDLAEIKHAGLTNQYGGDLFRSRLMIPLSNQAGETIGFTGRGLETNSVPKYLNTPSTLLYDKSRHVFALFQAKEAIRKANQVVIVEGNMDAISSHQAGVKNVVAAAGTALTIDHLKIVSRFTSDIRLAFDSDQAGINATERVIGLAQTAQVDIKIISMPSDAKDPDELIQQDVKLWQKAIDESVSAVDWLMQIYSTKYDLSTTLGKRDFSIKILAVISKLVNPVEKEDYLNKVSNRLGISVETLTSQLDSEQKVRKHLKTVQTVSQSVNDQYLYQDNLLAMGLISLVVREMLVNEDIAQLDGLERQKIGQFLIDHRVDLKSDDLKDLQDVAIRAKVLMLRAEERYSAWKQEELISEATRLIRQIKLDSQKLSTQKLTDNLRTAEDSGDDVLANKLRQQLNKIIKEK